MTILKTHGIPAQKQFADDVRSGLSRNGQKELPSKYLYDSLGSALFDAITLLPEYGLTRADARLLQRHGREIATHIPAGTVVTEMKTPTSAADFAEVSESIPAVPATSAVISENHPGW